MCNKDQLVDRPAHAKHMCNDLIVTGTVNMINQSMTLDIGYYMA